MCIKGFTQPSSRASFPASTVLESPAPGVTEDGRRALAKDVGVAPDGTGSHRLTLGGDAGQSSDPDGFAWEAASA